MLLGEQQHELERMRSSLVALKEEVARGWRQMEYNFSKLCFLLDEIKGDYDDQLGQIDMLVLRNVGRFLMWYLDAEMDDGLGIYLRCLLSSSVAAWLVGRVA